MTAPRRRPVGLAETVALVAFAVSMLGLLGFLLVVAGRKAPDSFVEDYDLPPVQTAAFVTTASGRMGWSRSTHGVGIFDSPEGAVTVRIEPLDSASRVMVSGPRRGVRALADFLNRKIPPYRPGESSTR